MQMHWFEKWAVNSFSGFYLRWYLLPRLLALMDGPLGGKGLALGPGVGWETLALFDFAYELNVLHHIRDYPAAIREVRRVLKPGGRFFLQDLSRHFFLPGLRQLFPPESLFTRAELVWQLEAAGFGVEAARGQAPIFLRARRR